jgi:hypothetical protein
VTSRSTCPPNCRHVFAVAAYRVPTLSSCFAGLLSCPVVSRALLVRGFATLACNFPLTFGIH